MSLKQRSFSAGRWTAASALARSGMQVLQTMVLARLLAPADFGLMALTASMVAVLGLFSDLGLSRAIIHFECISDGALASMYWLNLLMSAALSLVFAAVAPLLGELFKLGGLTSILIAASPIFVLSAAGQQFCTLAEKKLGFSALARIEISSTAIGFIVAVVVALRGGGAYALVAAALVTAAVNSTLAWWYLSGKRLPRLRLHTKEARPFLRFGGYLVGEGLVNTLIRQADVLVAGLMVNSAGLGMFSMPRDLSVRIGMVVNPIITRVGFPIMSRLQNDLLALKTVYLRTLGMTASVNFPVYTALAVFADDVVALLYGPQWKSAGLYLRILAVWGLLRSTGNPVGSLLHAVGAVRRALWWNIAILMILPAMYWVAINGWGLAGLAATMVTLSAALVVPSWYFLVRPCCPASLVEYLAQLAAPFLISLAAGLAAWLVARGVPDGVLRLAVGGTVGGLVYVGASRFFNRQWFDAMWSLLRLPRRRNHSPDAVRRTK